MITMYEKKQHLENENSICCFFISFVKSFLYLKQRCNTKKYKKNFDIKK
jgi:hypothetical protein